MEKPHIDTTAVEVPADLASPALYRVDAAHHPRVTVPRCCGIWVTAASRLSPNCHDVLSLSLNVWNWTLSPVACAAYLPSMPRAWTNKVSLAFAWSAPTLSCEVAISIDISKMPALPRSWHVPSAWTPSVACAPTGAQHPLEGAVLDAACSAYVEAAVEQMDQQVKTDAAVHGLAGNWRFSPATATARSRPSARSSIRSTPRGSSA